jgi:hypothetical protein
MAVTIIREICNNSSSDATVVNLEDPEDTSHGRGNFKPGQTRELREIDLAIPWCADGQGFNKRHIRVDVVGRRFAIWQASHEGLDRVRVSTDGAWHRPGEVASEVSDVIGGFAAVGVIEEFGGGGERTLVINDRTLWLLPFGLSMELKERAYDARKEGYRLCDPPVDRKIPSVPKKSAVAFSMAGHVSDAFDRGQAGARFLYRDSGKRYEFRIDGGVVHFQPATRDRDTLEKAISFRSRRAGDESDAPKFDLIAANGGRVFAKEKDWDRFYFAMVDHGYVQAGRDGHEFLVPSSSLTLDPEFNQPGARPEALAAPLKSEFDDFGGHPAAERWPAYRLLFSYGVIEAMLVRVRRFTWHLLDTRPPRGGQSNEFFRKIKEFAEKNPLQVLILARITGLADLPVPGVPGSELPGAPPPRWVPTYDHVCFCPNDPHPRVWRKSIDYKLVLDIGVGHIHHHEQYERITGGEIQPFFIGRDNPNWLYNAAEHYRFMFGPIRDGDGYIDGTCNFYTLVQLKDAAKINEAETNTLARRNAYALLWIDEQTFFTQRWHLVHPDDHLGVMISIVERLHTDPPRYQWKPELYWCPLRTGHVGPRSRLAVAAQVLLVTGEDPDSKQALLYSINFSFGTIDRSWRWRALPAPARYFDGESLWTPPLVNVTGAERVPDGADACVYPETVRLRDDMTIVLQGRGPGREGRTEVGRWYQRYLPANNELVPPAKELVPGEEPSDCVRLRSEVDERGQQIQNLITSRERLNPRNPLDRDEILQINQQIDAIRQEIDARRQEGARIGCRPNTPGARPLKGYNHDWKFLPEPVFQLADRFSHFGVFDLVDSRMQYYVVKPDSAADESALDKGHGGAWIDDLGQIRIDAYSFRFDWMRLPWPPNVPPPLEPKARPSLFNPDIRLRIVRRGSQWIAMHWDKRDDDLMPFTGLPLKVTLKFGEGPELTLGGGTVCVTLQENRWVAGPPAMRAAFFALESYGGKVRAVLGFQPSPGGRPLFEQLWRVRIAALDLERPGQIVSLHEPLTVEKFIPSTDIQSKPSEYVTPADRSRPPVDPTPADDSTSAKSYEYSWAPTSAEQAQFKQYCSASGVMKYGTSIWFEDIVGHVSVPEVIQWLSTEDEDPQTRRLDVWVDPDVVLAGPQVPLTVHAVDKKTRAAVTGKVIIGGGRPVGVTGREFRHAFGRVVFGGPGGGGPRGIVQAKGYPDADIPFRFKNA